MAGVIEAADAEEDWKAILTKADLPTPPEPNTTSLYSRMAGLFHWTAQQSALDKQGKIKIGQTK